MIGGRPIRRTVVAGVLWGTVGLLGVGVRFGSDVAAQTVERYRELRLQMVEEYIAREGVQNERVLSAMRQVPRHEFVPANQRVHAYDDSALPIGFQQTISPPFIVAYMTETIDPQPTDRVLEIGTGSGYQAAVLSGLVKDVYTIEIVEPLGKAAERALKRIGYDNVHAKVGDGYQGWPESAPFDKIIVTCSPEKVPEPLVEQLREGGKLLIPLGERYQQVFHLFEKRNGELSRSKLIPTLFVPMTGISEDQREVKPDPLKPRIVNGDFELDDNNDGRADNWHYQRQATVMGDGAPQGTRYVRLENSDLGRSAQMLQGLAIDGRKIGDLDVRLTVKVESITAGTLSHQKPALLIHFYDSIRRSIGDARIGPWTRDSDWEQFSKVVKVPLEAREAVVRIGLVGATGQLSVDDVSITPRER